MSKTYAKGVATEEKIPVIYDLNTGTKNVNCYADGYFSIDITEFREHTNKCRSSPYIFVAKSKRGKNKFKPLKEQHEAFVTKADILKKETDGKINMYKTGGDAKTAIQLFYDLNDQTQPEKITFEEWEKLENCYNGALIYAKETDIFTGYKYDICSEYPGIMRNQSMQFPMRKGKFKTITNLNYQCSFYSFGLYNAKVHNTDPRLFVQNKGNWYTHIDLNRAKELNYKIELIEVENNFLSYEGCLINGAKLFRKFVDYLFAFKQKGIKEAKDILNALWGALTEANHISLKTEPHKVTEIYDDREIFSICPSGNDMKSYRLKLIAKGNQYETNYARIKPFLTAKGRCIISKIVEKNLNSCVRIHTDGIILSEPIKNIKLGNNIGDLKFEGMAFDCKVKNCNLYHGNFYLDLNDMKTSIKKRACERKVKLQQVLEMTTSIKQEEDINYFSPIPENCYVDTDKE